MIDLYLSKNKKRNKELLLFLEEYRVDVTCHAVTEIDRDVLLNMMKLSPDCFDFLSPSLLRFKNYENLSLSEFIDLILRNAGQNLRLPLAIANHQVYPDLNLEEARALLPRQAKKIRYAEDTKCMSV